MMKEKPYSPWQIFTYFFFDGEEQHFAKMMMNLTDICRVSQYKLDDIKLDKKVKLCSIFDYYGNQFIVEGDFMAIATEVKSAHERVDKVFVNHSKN